MPNNLFERVGYKDPLLHTRVASYLEHSLSELCSDSKTPFPESTFRDLRDRLGYDIALLVRLGVFDYEIETQPGTVFSNDAEQYRGFVSLSTPEGIDPLYPTINGCTNNGDGIVRYQPLPILVDSEDVRFTGHRLAHDPEAATFAFSVYLWYLFLYEQKEIHYVSANGSSLTSSISLVPSIRIFSARNSLINSRIVLPNSLEYLELSGAQVDANIKLPETLKGYAAARTITGSLLHVPATVLDLDLYGCPADDEIVLPPYLESFCPPKYYRGLRSLPSSIKRLSIRGCSSFPFSSYVWPPSLEELELFEYCLDGKHNPFPHLKYMHVDPRLPHQIRFIPETVREDYRRSQEALEDRVKRNKGAFVSFDVKGTDCEHERFFISDFMYIQPFLQGPLLENLLFRLFPNANADVLQAVARQGILAGKEVMETTSKIADDSYTGVVFSADIDGVRVYCKISSDEQTVEREAQYLSDAWQYPFLRPITPKLLGTCKVQGAAGILTYGTENEEIISAEDMRAYCELRRNVFVACQTSLSVGLEDRVLIDVFNRALAHAILVPHTECVIYSTQQSPLILPFETLAERASVTKDRLFLDLMELRETYEETVKKYAEAPYFILGKTIVHFDGRPENIFPSAYQRLRPLGDPAFARVGFPEYDLARLESGQDHMYVSPYLRFREAIEKALGAEDYEKYKFSPSTVALLQERVRELSLLFAIRTFSSKLSRGVCGQAEYYRNLVFQIRSSSMK